MSITRAKIGKQLTGNKKKKPKGFKAVQKSIEKSQLFEQFQKYNCIY